jgi:hypothetical protein
MSNETNTMSNQETTKQTMIKKAIANINKLSFNKRGSRKTYTPFGIVCLYAKKNGTRWFSVRKGVGLYNGGSYTFRSLRLKISSL